MNPKDKKATILIVEDNEDNSFLLVSLLRKKYDLKKAVNGKEAVAQMENGGIDLVLMDLKMIVMDGFEATHLIREFNKETPIIAVSANVMESDRKKAEVVGCNDFLPKPIISRELFNMIEKYL
ncbi:MAG: response regulator [Bacteroidales bacterium]